MPGLDSYYTPMPLADRLAGYVNADNVRNAIDFCVGDGNLLRAVQKRYPNAELYGTDISSEAIKSLTESCPGLKLGECDFRDDESVEKVEFIKDGIFDLIIMNPPFTCKGSVVEKLMIDETEYHVSTAMLFLLKTLRFLSEVGGLYAIVPISCVYSEKDRKAWEYLRERYNGCVLEECNKVYFTNKCQPNIAMVYVGRKKIETSFRERRPDFSFLEVTEICRGSMRMQNLEYSTDKRSIPLIHTTNIQDGQLVKLRNVMQNGQKTVNGFGVIIPRVCNPNINKISVTDGREYILSECVILLKTKTLRDAETVKKHIINHWQEFVIIYSGTGAQYTTVERVRRLFGC